MQPGDVVLDCGAHVGTFSHLALERGAAKVIAVEPDPVNLECLRRNFREEIAAGKLVVAPVGVWSSEGTFKLSLGRGNSGMNSLVINRGGESIDVRTTTIDKLLAELKIGRVDFVKMDIEGAEREAIKGANATIARDKPRLMIEAYHLPDDAQILPPLIRAANPGYREVCGPCEAINSGATRYIPHVVFYQ
jgi:FkbM family methyltransferase